MNKILLNTFQKAYSLSLYNRPCIYCGTYERCFYCDLFI